MNMKQRCLGHHPNTLRCVCGWKLFGLQYKIRLCEKLTHVVALCEGVQQEENERDYPFRQFAKIKAILCLCAKRKFVHKGHAKSAWHINGWTLWWRDHKGGFR